MTSQRSAWNAQIFMPFFFQGNSVFRSAAAAFLSSTHSCSYWQSVSFGSRKIPWIHGKPPAPSSDASKSKVFEWVFDVVRATAQFPSPLVIRGPKAAPREHSLWPTFRQSILWKAWRNSLTHWVSGSSSTIRGREPTCA